MLAIVVWFALGAHGGDGAEPRFQPALAVDASVHLLKIGHLSQRPGDHELSQRWHRRFFEQLDPRRMYFLEADYQEFRRYEDRLFDLAKAKDLQFPELVRARFQTRVQEATAHARKLLSMEHDFTVDEECSIEHGDFAASRAELQERWRQRWKLELLIEKLHGRPVPEIVEQVSDRYLRINRQVSRMTDEQLCVNYLDSLSAAFDPHSAYLGPTLLESFVESNTLITRYSLGLTLREQRGRYIITDVHASLRDATRTNKLIGLSLIAITPIGGRPIDFVDLPINEGASIIRGAGGKLGTDREVILELLDPVTLERISLSWTRLPTRDFPVYGR